ncbi:MAG: peptidoglycan-binding domain-containing protein [Bacteroidota bacterium]
MRNSLCLLACCLSFSAVFAQPIPLPTTTPPTPEGDQCYALCYYPQQFREVTEEVSTYDGGTTLRVVAPAYETYTESVMVKPASYRLVEVPAEYGTEEVRIEVSPAYTEYTIEEAVFETVTERVLVEEGSSSYRLGNPEFDRVTNANLYYGVPGDNGSLVSSNYGNVLDPNNAQGITGANAPYNPNNENSLVNDSNSPLNASPSLYTSDDGMGALFDPDNPESPFSSAYIDANGIEAAQQRAGELLQMAGVGAIPPYLTSEARIEIDRVAREFETVTETIEVRPSYFTYEPRPIDCDEGQDCITLCAVEVPAQTTTVTRRIPQACPNGYTAATGANDDGRASDDDTEYCVRISYQPAEYGARQIMVAGPTIERRESDGEYREVQVRRMVSPARVVEREVSAEYQTVTKRVVTREAYTRVELIPAEYDNVTRRVRRGLRGAPFLVSGGVIMAPDTYGSDSYPLMVNPAAGGQVPGSVLPYTISDGPDRAGNIVPSGYAPVNPGISEGPSGMPDLYYTAGCPEGYRYDPTDGLCKATGSLSATGTTVTKYIPTEEGNFRDWTEVPCSDEVTEVSIRDLQRALNRAGYDAGPADGIMGNRTRAALTKYQQDNDLPVGQMNLPTLRALGLR